MNERQEDFFKELTYGSKYHFLEAGKDDDELSKIAEKAGVKLPAHDLAVFKGMYALVDEENGNGCTLPREEVASALDTLPHKSVDIDHLRKRVVGHWIHASLEGDEIITYGVFFKDNFPEDYEEIQNLMNDGNLKISFEAWGNREYATNGKSYKLNNIEFSGGALLVEEPPACKDARVLELAKKYKAPNEFFHEKSKETGSGKSEAFESARFYTWDFDMIMRLVSEVESSDGTLGWFDILSVDFENNKVRVKDLGDESIIEIDLTPSSKVVEKGRKVKDISVWRKGKNAKKEKMNKALREENMSDVLKDFQEASVEDKIKMFSKLVTEKATLEGTIENKDQEIASLNEKIEKQGEQLEVARKDLETATKDADEAKAEIAKREEAAKQEKVTARRDELGDFGKDLSDEDILVDDKYTIAKLQKENAELKDGKAPEEKEKETASQKMSTGSGQKSYDEIKKKADKVDKLAWG